MMHPRPLVAKANRIYRLPIDGEKPVDSAVVTIPLITDRRPARFSVTRVNRQRNSSPTVDSRGNLNTAEQSGKGSVEPQSSGRQASWVRVILHGYITGRCLSYLSGR